MRIILLLLLTLTGPFCTFTQASPTVPPTISAVTSKPESGSEQTVIKQTEETPAPVASTQATVADTTEKLPVMTEGVPAASTDAQVMQNESLASTAATESPKAGSEEKNDTQTTIGATTVVAVEPTVIEDNNNNETKSEPVDIEDDEGMGTGQVVGIVIGALIGVIVVIAIIILVARRMGQYSPAKKRKPQKQESILISPLKRKARQEEKKKKSGKF